MGKKKLAPRRKHSIPRLELSAAEEMADALSSEIDIRIDNTTFYTDSKAILGYTYNEFRHFCVNVSNRVEWIWKSSHLKQWRYLFTSHNPAYCTTRSFSVSSKYHLATWPSIPVKPATEPPPPKYQLPPGQPNHRYRDPTPSVHSEYILFKYQLVTQRSTKCST